MKRSCLAIVLVVTPVSLVPGPHAAWSPNAFAQDNGSAREAFDAAKELGTVEAWDAYIKAFPKGFFSDLARAYVKKLGGDATALAAAPSAPAISPPAKTESTPAVADRPQVELGENASLSGARLLPDDSPWHLDVSEAPVDPKSRIILGRLGDKPLHPDFGPIWKGVPIGIPYVVVPGTQPKVRVTFATPDESDPGPYPIPPQSPIEGGPKGDGDRHVLVLDRDNWVLYEIFNATPQPDGSWKADSGAIWDLKKNQVRPDRWTSADAAGLPILPGLVRYDEVVGAGALEHALRLRSRKRAVPMSRPRAIGRASGPTKILPRWECGCG